MSKREERSADSVDMFKKSGRGNTIYFKVGIWYNSKKDVIEVRSMPNGNHLISTVSFDSSLKRGHPNLFNQLAKILRDNDAPAPDMMAKRNKVRKDIQ